MGGNPSLGSAEAAKATAGVGSGNSLSQMQSAAYGSIGQALGQLGKVMPQLAGGSRMPIMTNMPQVNIGPSMQGMGLGNASTGFGNSQMPQQRSVSQVFAGAANSSPNAAMRPPGGMMAQSPTPAIQAAPFSPPSNITGSSPSNPLASVTMPQFHAMAAAPTQISPSPTPAPQPAAAAAATPQWTNAGNTMWQGHSGYTIQQNPANNAVRLINSAGDPVNISSAQNSFLQNLIKNKNSASIAKVNGINLYANPAMISGV